MTGVRSFLKKHRDLAYATISTGKTLSLLSGATYLAHTDRPIAASISYGLSTIAALTTGYFLGRISKQKTKQIISLHKKRSIDFPYPTNIPGRGLDFNTYYFNSSLPDTTLEEILELK